MKQASEREIPIYEIMWRMQYMHTGVRRLGCHEGILWYIQVERKEDFVCTTVYMVEDSLQDRHESAKVHT